MVFGIFLIVAYCALHGILAIWFLVLLAVLARRSVVSGCLRWSAVPFAALDLIAAAMNFLPLGNGESIFERDFAPRIGQVDLIALAIVVALAVHRGRKSLAREGAPDDGRPIATDSTTRSATGRLRTALVLGLLGLMMWELHMMWESRPRPTRFLHEETDVDGVHRRLVVEKGDPKDPGIRLLWVVEASPPLEDSTGAVDSAGIEWAWTQLGSDVDLGVPLGSDVDLDMGYGHIRRHPDRLLARELEALAPTPGNIGQVTKLALIASRAAVLSAAASITSLSPAAFDAILRATEPEGALCAPMPSGRKPGGRAFDALEARRGVLGALVSRPDLGPARTDAILAKVIPEHEPGILVALAEHGAPTDTILSWIAKLDSANIAEWTADREDVGITPRNQVLKALVRSERLAGLPEAEADRIAAAAGDHDGPVLVALIGHASRAALEKAAGTLSPAERKTVLDALAEPSPR
jgi:hypothetical protein